MNISIVEVLRAIQSLLQGLTVSDGSAAFETVALYDLPNLDTALSDLLENTTARVCLVVPSGIDYASTQTGTSMIISPILSLELILSHQDYEPGKPALWGSDVYPGVVNIIDPVRAMLDGNQLSLDPRLTVVPQSAGSIRVAADEETVGEGREGMVLGYQVHFPPEKYPLNRGAHLSNLSKS